MRNREEKMMETLSRIDDVLESGCRTAAIVGHIRPDGDCVGSCMGLWEYIRINYPDISADVYLDPCTESIAFLEKDKPVNPQRGADMSYDVVFALDSAERARIGAGKEYLEAAKQIICIDHHISNPGYGDINVIYPDYSSACEVLYTLLTYEKLNAEAAKCLYTGMVHDTGVFQYSDVSPLTMQRAGKLMTFGFDFSSIISESFYEKSLTHQHLKGIAMQRARLTEDKEGVWSYVTLDDMISVNSNPMEADGIVEALRNTVGIDYSIFIYETKPGEMRVSLRSKKKADVSVTAMAFGGGGHVRAAGCSFNGLPPEEIKTLLVNHIMGKKYD